MPANVVLCCGEMSGDMHAAALVNNLTRTIADVKIRAMGGERCAGAGAEVLFDYRDHAILGFSEVLRHLPKLYRLERGLKRLIDEADLFIAVDYPGLNLRLARYARARGVPVLYYIAPQLWAWGAGRMKKIARCVDRLAVILPFEEDFYRKGGVEAEFVGHPFVVDHGLEAVVDAGERRGVGLLPGSRTQEVRRILPSMVEASAMLASRDASLRFTIGKSPLVASGVYEAITDDAGVAMEIEADSTKIMRRASLLLVASGTATLQAALYETPLVVTYRVSALNYFLAKRLVTIDNIGLVNVVLEDRVAPEFVQGDATPDNIAIAAAGLLEDDAARGDMTRRFATLREMLGGGRGTVRVAEMAAELLEK